MAWVAVVVPIALLLVLAILGAIVYCIRRRLDSLPESAEDESCERAIRSIRQVRIRVPQRARSARKAYRPSKVDISNESELVDSHGLELPSMACVRDVDREHSWGIMMGTSQKPLCTYNEAAMSTAESLSNPFVLEPRLSQISDGTKALPAENRARSWQVQNVGPDQICLRPNRPTPVSSILQSFQPISTTYRDHSLQLAEPIIHVRHSHSDDGDTRTADFGSTLR